MSSSEEKELFSGKTFDQMLGLDDALPEGTPLELDIDTLRPFPNQPFHPYKEDEMEKLVESVRENGVISPIVVRPKEDGTYEIISGHNRVEACRRAGFTYVPSFIREADDDTAVILMVDSNLRQREELSDMEKARAYEMKISALNRKLGRPLKKEGQVVLASFAGEGTSQVGRSFLKSYAGVCLQGVVIILACIIYSVLTENPTIDTSGDATSVVWAFLFQLIFNFLVLVGAVKMSDRVVKEMIGF